MDELGFADGPICEDFCGGSVQAPMRQSDGLHRGLRGQKAAGARETTPRGHAADWCDFASAGVAPRWMGQAIVDG